MPTVWGYYYYPYMGHCINRLFSIGLVRRAFLSNYVASLPLIQILLCSIVFGSIIQILHVNYYRTHNKQRQYFLLGFVALVFAILLNFLIIKTWVDLRIVAVAMLFNCFIWYLINELSLKQFVTIKSGDTGKSIIAIFSYIAAFWLLSILCKNVFAQFGLYLFFFC